MRTVYDIQQILKKFGIYVYTGDRLGDLMMMELEINELYQAQFILPSDYQIIKLVLRGEVRLLEEAGSE